MQRGECTNSSTSIGHHNTRVLVAGNEAAADNLCENVVDRTSTDQLSAVSSSNTDHSLIGPESVHGENLDNILEDPVSGSAEVEQNYNEIECPGMSSDVSSIVTSDLLSSSCQVPSHTDMCVNSEPCDCTSLKSVESLPGVDEVCAVEAGSENLDADSLSDNVSLESSSLSSSCIQLGTLQDDDAERQLLHRKENAALCIQTAYRRHVAQKAYIARQRAVAALQQLAVGYLYSVRFHVLRGAAITLQATFRRHLCRHRYLLLHTAVCHIQARYRGQVCQRRYQAVRSSVIAVQASARGYLDRKKLLALRLCREQAAIRLQAHFRGYSQRQKYKRAVDVAGSLGLLQPKQPFMQLPGKLQQCLISAAQSGMSKDKMIETIQNLAAMKIQTTFAAWRYRRQRAAIITCQRSLQTLPYRIHFVRLRFAAVTMQTKWRAACLTRVARENFLNHIGAAIVIQSVVRTFLCRSRYLRLRHAVITMQREYHQRKQLADNYSATVIQSAVRMFIIRNRFLKARRAAVKIQSFYRCREQRAKFRLMVTNAVIIQQWFGRQIQLRQRKAATKIQSFVRMVSMRQQYRSILQKVAIIQRHTRSFLMRKKFLSIRKSAVTIQRHWRGKMLYREAKIRHAIRLGATIVIQAAFRGYLQRRAYVTMRTEHQSAIKVQKLFHGYLARRHCKKQMKALVLLQAGCRRALVQRHIRRQTCAAVVIQRAVRTILAQRQYQKMQKCIATFQSVCRGFLARQQLKRMQEAAVKIQKIYRGFAARHQFFHQYRCIVCLQAYARSLFVRRRLEAKHKACTVIQSVVRRQQMRQLYCKQLSHIRDCLLYTSPSPRD